MRQLLLIVCAMLFVQASTTTTTSTVGSNIGSSSSEAVAFKYSNSASLAYPKTNDLTNSEDKESFRSSEKYSLDIVHRVRGGSDDEYDEEEDEDEEEMDGMGESAAAVAIDIAKKTARVIGKVSLLTYKRFRYALTVSLESNEGDKDGDDTSSEETSIPSMLLSKVSRFLTALLQGPESVAVTESATSSAKKEVRKKLISSTISESFVSYLKSGYGVKVHDSSIVIDGPLSDVLKTCRSQAKFLVAFIPANSNSSKKKDSADLKAATALFSEEVDAVAQYKGGSFGLWGCAAGSREASSATKRIRASVRKSIPVLAVIYPAQVIDSSGKPKVVPKLLAQHHCNPPPSSTAMAAWLKALRKRHSKQIKAMKHELKEQELFIERQEGYKSSAKQDKEREEKEAIAEAERIAKEEAEKEKIIALDKRRELFLETLPDEPSQGSENVITIALRFADGRNAKRRFDYGVKMEFVFNWVDAEFKIERENVIFSTMNGSQSFTIDDSGEVTLRETGLGKMTGLRVSERETKAECEDSNVQEANVDKQ